MKKNLHDSYGKSLFDGIEDFSTNYEKCKIKYGTGGSGARIDGVIRDTIAIEIESRVSKQVRGAILDLILHKNPKKLLVLIPVHMKNPENTRSQSIFILSKFLKENEFDVVLVEGTGGNNQLKTDKVIIKEALKKLEYRN